MITHAGARTRALYSWEETDIQHRDGIKRINDITDYRNIADQLGFSVPKIEIHPGVHYYPFCEGRTRIVMTGTNNFNYTFIHELAHFDRGGTSKNCHTVGFVRKYIRLLVRYFGWDEEELLLQAHWRGFV